MVEQEKRIRDETEGKVTAIVGEAEKRLQDLQTERDKLTGRALIQLVVVLCGNMQQRFLFVCMC